MLTGELCRHLFGGTGQSLRRRRKGIGPQPKEDQAADGQHDLEDHEGRRIGLKPIEAYSAQGRPDADTHRKDPKHDPVELGVIAQPEIAAGEERHQIDLGTDAEPAGYCTEKWRKPPAPLARIAMPAIGKTKKVIA